MVKSKDQCTVNSFHLDDKIHTCDIFLGSNREICNFW